MTGTEMLFFAATVYIATLGPMLIWKIRYPVEESTWRSGQGDAMKA